MIAVVLFVMEILLSGADGAIIYPQHKIFVYSGKSEVLTSEAPCQFHSSICFLVKDLHNKNEKHRFHLIRITQNNNNLVNNI